MIKKLNRKFIFYGIASVFFLLVIVVGGLNVISFSNITKNADALLEKLPVDEEALAGEDEDSKREPAKPKDTIEKLKPMDKDIPSKKPQKKGEDPKEEVPSYILDQHYFTVTFDKSGNITDIDSQNISTVDDDKAEEYGLLVYENASANGFAGKFRYEKREVKDGITIVFLNCIKELVSFKEFLVSSIIMSIIGFVLVTLGTIIVAYRSTRPIAIAYQKQARFITDAGHGLKTPLSVINANLELLEPELKNNESFDDITQQVGLLKELTDNLISLARIEESRDTAKMIEFPISDTISETVLSFATAAQSTGHSISCHITPLLSFKGNNDMIKQLTRILMDNAIKHSPENTPIDVSLRKKNKQIILSITNKSAKPLSTEELSLVFERFFRCSDSHGYGIGLSKAKSIIDAHNGRISAATNDQNDFIITVCLPT